jgi:hypothetical protein
MSVEAHIEGFRRLAGLSAPRSYNETMMAAARKVTGITSGTANEHFIKLLQSLTGSSDNSLPNLQARYAAFFGATNFGAVNKLPSLLFDFTSGQLDSRITFTRSSSGTYVGSDGLIKTAATNVPRFDYDPVTLAPKGLLIEEARTNLCLQSAALKTSSPWIAEASTNVTITADTDTAPDGAVAADTVTTASTTDPRVQQNIAVANDSVTRAGSIFVKKTSGKAAYGALRLNYSGGTGVNGYAVFNENTGVITATSAAVAASGVENYGTYWRVWVAVANNTTGNTILSLSYYPAWNLDGSTTAAYQSGVSSVLWGAQLEAASFPSTYIPTTTASVTRTADVATVSDISGFFNAAEGTIVWEGDFPSTAGNRNLFSIDDGTANERITPFFVTGSETLRYQVTDGGVAVILIDLAGAAVNTSLRATMAYKLNDFGASLGGGAVGTDTSGTLPVVTTFRLGTNVAPANYLNGHIRRFAYWGTRLSNTVLQRLSA